MRFDKLDLFIRKNIPSGQAVRSSLHEMLGDINAFASRESDFTELPSLERFGNEIRKLCEKQGRDPDRVFASLGTLGGENHFIEIDVDESHNRWLLIHFRQIRGRLPCRHPRRSALRKSQPCADGTNNHEGFF